MNKQTFYRITEFLARGSPFLVLPIVLGKLFELSCIDTTNKMYMLIAIIFIYTYAVNKYWDATKQ